MMPHCFMTTSHYVFSFHCVLVERPLVAEMTYCVFQPEYEKPALALGFKLDSQSDLLPENHWFIHLACLYLIFICKDK